MRASDQTVTTAQATARTASRAPGAAGSGTAAAAGGRSSTAPPDLRDAIPDNTGAERQQGHSRERHPPEHVPRGRAEPRRPTTTRPVADAIAIPATARSPAGSSASPLRRRRQAPRRLSPSSSSSSRISPGSTLPVAEQILDEQRGRIVEEPAQHLRHRATPLLAAIDDRRIGERPPCFFVRDVSLALENPEDGQDRVVGRLAGARQAHPPPLPTLARPRSHSTFITRSSASVSPFDGGLGIGWRSLGSSRTLK